MTDIEKLLDKYRDAVQNYDPQTYAKLREAIRTEFNTHKTNAEDYQLIAAGRAEELREKDAQIEKLVELVELGEDVLSGLRPTVVANFSD